MVDARSGRTIVVTHPPDQPFWPELLGPRAAETWGGLQSFHQTRGTDVSRGALPGSPVRYYFKVNRRRNFADCLKFLLRGPRAARAWRAAREAAQLGFRVVQAACLVSTPRGCVRPLDVLITEEVPDAVPVFVRLKRGTPARDRWRLLAAVGAEVARWHARRLLHSDLNLGNLLVSGPADAPVITWLDVEGNRRFPLELPLSRRTKNLVDINFEPYVLSRTDRLRLWRAYCVGAGLSSATERKLLRRVVALTERRWRARGWPVRAGRPLVPRRARTAAPP